MVIVFQDKQFEDKKQALCEFAFCHYPLSILVDGKECVFEDFSTLESFINSLE